MYAMYASDLASIGSFEMSRAQALSSGNSGQPAMLRAPATGCGPRHTRITTPLGGPPGKRLTHAAFTTDGAPGTLPMNAPASITHTAASRQPFAVAAVARLSTLPPPHVAS